MNNYIDTDFELKYEENINIILSQPSGQYFIDNVKSKQFIDSQTSELRRSAAKALIENTIYITLEETMNIIEQLILQLYQEKNLNDEENFYFYSGNSKKSFYLVAVISLYFIKKYNFKHPIFIKELNNDIFDTNKHVIILDDVSYSGSQLSKLLYEIYYNRVIIDKKSIPKISLLLIAVNTYSLEKLSVVPINKYKIPGYNEYNKFINTPFSIYFLIEHKYLTLAESVGEEMYLLICLLFSFWTKPYISLYLDFKLADSPSTFLITILYGPVPPHQKLIDELKYLHKIDDVFFKEYGNAYKQVINDITDRPETTEITFYPFINNCNQKIETILLNKNIHKLNYLLFLAPENCIKTTNFNSTKCQVDENFYELIDELVNNEIENNFLNSKEQLNDLQTIIYKRCPDSWYKQLLKGGKRKKHKNTNKNKKHKNTNKKNNKNKKTIKKY